MPSPSLVDRLVRSLCEEIRSRSRDNKKIVNAIYFGGGTPSILTIIQIKQLLEVIRSNFQILDSAEISMEINPQSISNDQLKDYLKGIFDLGVNRISLGIQNVNEKISKLMGRDNDLLKVREIVKYTNKLGMHNIALDFICGYMEETLDIVNENLNFISELGDSIKHISYYDLELGSPLLDNELISKLPLEDFYIEARNLIDHKLKLLGLERYEVSNYARIGSECKYNYHFWNHQDYWGFGPSAHSFSNGCQHSYHKSDLVSYIENPLEREFEQKLSNNQALTEKLVLALRLNRPLDLKDYKMDSRHPLLMQFREQGLIRLNENVLIVTTAGFRVLDSLTSTISELI